MSVNSFELLLRRATNRIGFDLTRYRPERSEAGRLSLMLNHHKVNLVLDVGANTGQFAKALRQGGYQGKMLSFEPLSTALSLIHI